MIGSGDSTSTGSLIFALKKVKVLIEVRRADKHDFPAIVGVYRTVWPDRGLTLERMLELERSFESAEYFRTHFVAEEPNGDIVGLGLLTHSLTEFDQHNLNIEVAVRPEWRRRGIGSRIFGAIEDESRSKGFRSLWAETRSDSESGVSFLSTRGFHLKRRKWQSSLELDSFVQDKYAGLVEKLRDSGIGFSSAREEKRLSENWERKFYELNTVTGFDVPRTMEYTPPTFQQALMYETRSSSFVPELCVIAKKDGEYIARTGLLKAQGIPNVLLTTFTCTKREYRNMGVATSLKSIALGNAKEMSFKSVSTINDSLNLPMLAVNETLGFHKVVEIMRFEKSAQDSV